MKSEFENEKGDDMEDCGLIMAEELRTATEWFLGGINETLHQWWTADEFDTDFHPCDITYRNGLLLGGVVDNAVVQFHIKECPGWLFGIFWDKRLLSTGSGVGYGGSFIAQYEETIDKFKPGASRICDDIQVFRKLNSSSSIIAVLQDILFIWQEPDLAFCRDYYSIDLNRRYITREEAKKYRTAAEDEAQQP